MSSLYGAMFGGCSCKGDSLSGVAFAGAFAGPIGQAASDDEMDAEFDAAVAAESARGPMSREVPKPGTPGNPIVLPGITLVGRLPVTPVSPSDGPVYDTPFGPENRPSSGSSSSALGIGAVVLGGALLLSRRRKSGYKRGG